MTGFGDCTFCGGDVEETRIEYDYWRRESLSSLVTISRSVSAVWRDILQAGCAEEDG